MKKGREEKTKFSKLLPNNQIITACRIELRVQQMTMNEKLTMIALIVEKLLFLYGQASVKIGFSINRNIEESNLRAEPFIAQWRICDFVYSVGGIFNVNINKLMAARSAYSAYKIH